MHHDDRLATALRARIGGEGAARIQLRQLIDLLGTTPAEAQGPLLDDAYDRLAQLSARIPVAERAAMLAPEGLRLRSPRLVAALAASDPAVGVAAVRAARLSEDQWLDLIPALPLSVRGVMRVRGDLGARVRALLTRLGIGDRGLTDAAQDAQGERPGAAALAPAGDAPALASASAAEPDSRPAPEGGSRDEGIGAIVRRIEAFRRAREAAQASATTLPENDDGSLQLPLDDVAQAMAPAPAPLAVIDFAADAQARISWSDQAAAPMLVGTDLGAQTGLATALRQRQPIRATRITLRGSAAIAGEWQVDAAPQFDANGGRFNGYLGRLRRPAPVAAAATPPPNVTADRLRQVLHELRTPVNAIQGFAEVIQQQLFGATPHQYRALAAAIAGDAAQILAGFEELERLARLGDGTLRPEAGECDLGGVVTATHARLVAPARARGIELRLAPSGVLPVGIAPQEAERMVGRLVSTIIDLAKPGATLDLGCAPEDGFARLWMTLPAELAGCDDATLLQATAPVSDTGPGATMFGTGFALRLVAAEARACGGRLCVRQEMVNLVVPYLTTISAHHSGEAGARTEQG
jgi:signal transduction histidine kinase